MKQLIRDAIWGSVKMRTSLSHNCNCNQLSLCTCHVTVPAPVAVKKYILINWCYLFCVSSFPSAKAWYATSFSSRHSSLHGLRLGSWTSRCFRGNRKLEKEVGALCRWSVYQIDLLQCPQIVISCLDVKTWISDNSVSVFSLCIHGWPLISGCHDPWSWPWPYCYRECSLWRGEAPPVAWSWKW